MCQRRNCRCNPGKRECRAGWVLDNTVVAGLTFRRGPLVSQGQPGAGLTVSRPPAPPAVHS